MSRPTARPSVASGSPRLAESVASRLSADAYLDLRHPGFAWFEHLGVIRAEGAEVVIEPLALEVLTALAGATG